MLVVMLPFSILMYRQSETYVADSINNSNELYLQQMKQDYLLFKENISSLCLSTFYRTDVQKLMYLPDCGKSWEGETLLDIRKEIVMAQPSLYSVEIYNAQNGKLYSTENAAKYTTVDSADLFRFLQEQDREQNPIPKLVPLLRKLPLRNFNQTEIWVFSYFMYDYSAPSTTDGSFLVINQNASWFVESLTRVQQSDFDSQAYLVSNEGSIINYDVQDIDTTEEQMISDCVAIINQGTLEAAYGSYVTDGQAERYLISWLSLEDHEDMIVLVQNYNEVFQNLKNLSNGMFLLVAGFTLAAILIILLVSHLLYKPLGELVTYAQELDEDEVLQPGDEFSNLHTFLEHSSTKAKQLMKQKTVREAVLQRLMLANLLQDASRDSWKRYRSILQDAPLSRQQRWNLAVVLVRVEYGQDNQFGFLESEENVLHYAIYNMFSEIVEKGVVERIKHQEGESVFIVNLAEEETHSLEELLDLLRVLARKNLDVSLTLACSRCSDTIHQLPELYQEARTCLRYEIVYDRAAILNMELCRRNEHNPNFTYNTANEKQLLDAMRMQRVEKALEAADLIREDIRFLQYDYITVSMIELLTKLKDYFNETRDANRREINADFLDLYRQVISKEPLDKIFGDLKICLQTMVEQNPASGTLDSEKQFAEQIIAFIEQNYADSELGLQTIAKQIGLTERYVSRKFRQNTDISINEYILGYRMQRAAEMLINTEMSVEKVAESIGIQNRNYFYHLFKKQFGCTPREFSMAKNGGEEETT